MNTTINFILIDMKAQVLVKILLHVTLLFINKRKAIRKTLLCNKKRFYVNCWGEIKISFQFITLFGFHFGGNFLIYVFGFYTITTSRIESSKRRLLLIRTFII